MKLFHPSIELGQHSGKGLKGAATFAKNAGATGVILSNFLLQKDDEGTLLPASEIEACTDAIGVHIDAVSAHCPFWAHTSAWTGTKSFHKFVPTAVTKMELKAAEQWLEDYILRVLDCCAALGVKTVAMFWGVAQGWELATGYPWAMWEGPGYDLVKEAKDRFPQMTKKIRDHARALGIKLCHEIHPNTFAMCARDFEMTVQICDGDECLAALADPSHTGEGEDFRTRFLHPAVRERLFLAHVKDMVVRRAMALRCMEPDWKNRPMHFTALGKGDLNLTEFVNVLFEAGYGQRYCKLVGSESAPLAAEAESAHQGLDETAAQGIAFVRDQLCFDVATVSFEKQMGQK